MKGGQDFSEVIWGRFTGGKGLTNYSKGIFFKKKKYSLDLTERKESTSQVGGWGQRDSLEAGGSRKLITYRGALSGLVAGVVGSLRSQWASASL